MRKYFIEFSLQSRTDLLDLNNVIIYKYQSPSTAYKYMHGLSKEVKKLESMAETLPFQSRKSLAQYGQNVRRINYKKMAVIYTVHNDLVLIHRVIPSNTIGSL
jgi:hypothetical protein